MTQAIPPNSNTHTMSSYIRDRFEGCCSLLSRVKSVVKRALVSLIQFMSNVGTFSCCAQQSPPTSSNASGSQTKLQLAARELALARSNALRKTNTHQRSPVNIALQETHGFSVLYLNRMRNPLMAGFDLKMRLLNNKGVAKVPLNDGSANYYVEVDGIIFYKKVKKNEILNLEKELDNLGFQGVN